MAVLTSHLLSGLDGTHASGISVSLFQMKSSGSSEKVLSKITDQGGRFSAEFKAEANGRYVLVVSVDNYFSTGKTEKPNNRIISDIVIRALQRSPHKANTSHRLKVVRQTFGCQ